MLAFFGWLVFGLLFCTPKWWSLLSYGTLCYCFIMEKLLFCLEYFLKKRFLERKGLSFTVFLRNCFILFRLCPIFICLVSLLWPCCYSDVSDCCTSGFWDCSTPYQRDMADQMPYGFDHLNCFLLWRWFWVCIQKLDIGKLTVIQRLTWKS